MTTRSCTVAPAERIPSGPVAAHARAPQRRKPLQRARAVAPHTHHVVTTAIAAIASAAFLVVAAVGGGKVGYKQHGFSRRKLEP